jgi:L-lactate dehydrogenase (cytochrome)
MTRFRLGQDVMRALALGARSSMIGRAYAFGLGAGGEAGVAKALDILGKEMLTIFVRRQHGCCDRR